MKKNALKLRLSKETLVNLDDTQWKKVVGGVSFQGDTDCTYCTTAKVSKTACDGCPTKP